MWTQMWRAQTHDAATHFVSRSAVTPVVNSVSGHITDMHLIGFFVCLWNFLGKWPWTGGHGHLMGIGRRLRGEGGEGLEGPIAFGSSAKSSRWVATFLSAYFAQIFVCICMFAYCVFVYFCICRFLTRQWWGCHGVWLRRFFSCNLAQRLRQTTDAIKKKLKIKKNKFKKFKKISHKNDGRRPMQLKRRAHNSRNPCLGSVCFVSESNWCMRFGQFLPWDWTFKSPRHP